MTKSLPVGDYTAAKLDYLHAASRKDENDRILSIGVNRTYCRPLRPHGIKMINEGFLKLERSGIRTCRHSRITITPKGEKELERLQKRADKLKKRHQHAPFSPPHRPHHARGLRQSKLFNLRRP